MQDREDRHKAKRKGSSQRLAKRRDNFHNCKWCGIKLLDPKQFRTAEERRTSDHIIERHRGGKNVGANIKISCSRCNSGRDMFGGCIAALACYSAIVGEKAPLNAIASYIRTKEIAIPRSTRNDQVKRYGFPEARDLDLYLNNDHHAKLKAKDNAKILYEGTSALPVFKGYEPSNRKRSLKNALNFKISGYDAVWLMKFGLLVLNQEAFDAV